MKATAKYLGKPPRFWANVRLISEQVGYSERKKKREEGRLKTYSINDAIRVYKEAEHLDPKFVVGNQEFFRGVTDYLNFRAQALMENVRDKFMDRDQARREHEKLFKKHPKFHPALNKQTGEKAHEPYLANMVGMIAEDIVGAGNYVNDARRLSVITESGIAETVFSRRFDGAYPDTVNPTAVWEIKEYYGTTTFGSRVSGGVYETQLDGYEINAVLRELKRTVHHFLFVDDRFTWWDCGRSYLCRMVDMLHAGHVDEILREGGVDRLGQHACQGG